VFLILVGVPRQAEEQRIVKLAAVWQDQLVCQANPPIS